MTSWTHEDYLALRKNWGNSTLVGWKLTYTDGTEIRSSEMSFASAPQDNVQILIKYYKTPTGRITREVQNGLDMYVLYSELPLWLDLPPEVKKGENLTNDEFEEVISTARADPELVTEMQPEDLPETVRAKFPGLRF